VPAPPLQNMEMSSLFFLLRLRAPESPCRRTCGIRALCPTCYHPRSLDTCTLRLSSVFRLCGLNDFPRFLFFFKGLYFELVVNTLRPLTTLPGFVFVPRKAMKARFLVYLFSNNEFTDESFPLQSSPGSKLTDTKMDPVRPS